VTGMAGMTAELAGKSVELIREMIPSATQVALCNGPDQFYKSFLQQIELGGRTAGVAIKPIILGGNNELDGAFTTMSAERVDAVIVQPSRPTRRAAELAVNYHLPAVSVPRRFADEGGLLSYSPRQADIYREAASYVDKNPQRREPRQLAGRATN